MIRLLYGLLLALTLAGPTLAETAMIAVAANFRKPLQELATAFEHETEHELVISAGSTGQLYAQIGNGAPYDVFLAADEERPARAIAKGFAVPGSERIYAIGRLVLLTRDAGLRAELGTPPDLSRLRTLSIANPVTAPYGAAAMEVLEKMGVAEAMTGRLAEAQNISGVNAAVHTGAAEAGFAALSSLAQPDDPGPAVWVVPADLHEPIRQGAVLLIHGQENPAAIEFLRWLDSPAAAELIRSYGYDLPDRRP